MSAAWTVYRNASIAWCAATPSWNPGSATSWVPGRCGSCGPGRTVVTGGEATLRAYFTPGHEDDHVSYYLAAGRTVFSGDTILGSSSSSVRNLKQYMDSLRTLARLKPLMLCPGHGQTISNGTARVEWYINHRTEREEQVLAALKAGAESVDEVVTAVYPRNLRRNLRSAAARNVQTHLEKLREEGRITESSAAYAIVPAN